MNLNSGKSYLSECLYTIGSALAFVGAGMLIARLHSIFNSPMPGAWLGIGGSAAVAIGFKIGLIKSSPERQAAMAIALAIVGTIAVVICFL